MLSYFVRIRKRTLEKLRDLYFVIGINLVIMSHFDEYKLCESVIYSPHVSLKDFAVNLFV